MSIVTSIDTADTQWYVARIKPGEASRAITNLKRRAINFCHPTANILGRDVALMAGYLFVNLTDDVQEFSLVSSTPGIDKLLPTGAERPSKIPDSYMQELFTRLANCEYDVVVSTPKPVELPRFRKDEVLGINSGPFAGHTGTFVRVHKGIVELCVGFFGLMVSAKLNGHQVQRLM